MSKKSDIGGTVKLNIKISCFKITFLRKQRYQLAIMQWHLLDYFKPKQFLSR